MPILAKDPNDGAYGTDLTQGLKCKVWLKYPITKHLVTTW
jgi:hypothetical protein